MIDFDQLFARDLPAAAGRWRGTARYNFIGGHTAPEIVPVDGLIASAERVLRREGRSLAAYNLGGDPQGHAGLRAFVADKLATKRGIAATADDILITSGSLQGLDLVNQILLEPGDTVIMEQLTYSGAIERARRRGVAVIGVPLDEGGMRIDLLAAALDSLRANGVRPKYIYTIPTIQNPTGTVLSLDRRRELLRLSAAHEVPVFEDECYADLLWEGVWPTALRGLEGGAEVIHIGSFSKTLAPALRLGYVSAPWPVLSRLLACKNDGGTPALEQMIVADYFGAHFDDHVRGLKSALRHKLETLTGALEEQFGAAAEFRPPQGGIFLWVTLPDQVDTAALAGPALAAGVAFNPGPDWAVDPAAARHSLRLCFGHPRPAEIQAGIERLAEVCHRETGIPERSANVARRSRPHPAG
jgi:2-aminoadipate transaminase